MVIIYTTCHNTQEAVKLGQTLLERKLASAINLWPIQVMKGSESGIKSELAAGMFIKTLEPKITEIENTITEFHTSSMPYVGAIEIRRFNRPYREWMGTVIKI